MLPAFLALEGFRNEVAHEARIVVQPQRHAGDRRPHCKQDGHSVQPKFGLRGHPLGRPSESDGEQIEHAEGGVVQYGPHAELDEESLCRAGGLVADGPVHNFGGRVGRDGPGGHEKRARRQDVEYRHGQQKAVVGVIPNVGRGDVAAFPIGRVGAAVAAGHSRGRSLSPLRRPSPLSPQTVHQHRNQTRPGLVLQPKLSVCRIVHN